MSATLEEITALRATVADLQRQLELKSEDIEELKADKRDLRCLVAKQREELEVAKAASSALAAELQRATLEVEAISTRIMQLEESKHNATDTAGITQAARPSSSSVKESGTPHAAQLKEVRCASIEIIDDPTTISEPSGAKGKRKASIVDTGPPQKRTRPSRTATVTGTSGSPATVPRYLFTRPAIKIDHDRAFVLPLDVLASLLKHAAPIRISPEPSKLHVLRQLIQTCYGTNPKQNVQYIETRRNPSGARRPRVLVLPRHDLHPSMPLLPGHSGVIVAGRYDPVGEGPYSLFRKDLKGASTWLYLGEYQWSAAGKMSATVFRNQPESVKQALAAELVTPKRSTSVYYLAMRARIALRKAGFLHMEGNTSENELVKKELDRIHCKTPTAITEEDVIASLSRGEEAIDLIRLRCVSYDHVFAKDIEAKFRASKASKRHGGRPKGLKSKSSAVHPKARETPFFKVKQPITSVQPGVYSTPAAASSSRRQNGRQEDDPDWCEPSVMDALDWNDSLTPASRPVRSTRSTWDVSTGQKIRQESSFSPGQSSQEVIDLIHEFEDFGDVDDACGIQIMDLEAELEEDVMMGGADDDGYLSYVSEEAVGNGSHGYT